MKPLARWIVGPVKPNGFKCLEIAIKNFNKLYPEFDLMICHNQLNINQMKELETFDIPLFEQKHENGLSPKGVAWKLYPPRIRKETHELVMDNDLIITRKIPQIDKFLKSNCTLVYEAGKPMYGQFHKFVPKNPFVNSGIYGMPPGFNFLNKINFYIKNITEWDNSCKQGRYTWDEQGLVAASLLNHPNHLLIKLNQISNCEIDLIDNCCGMHFVGLNRYVMQKPWLEWRIKSIKTFI